MNKQNTENSKTVNLKACPVCGDTNNVYFGELNQVSDGGDYCDCECKTCGATWKSWYKYIFSRDRIDFVFDKNSDIEKGTK
jgi:hypothetical protein